MDLNARPIEKQIIKMLKLQILFATSGLFEMKISYAIWAEL